MVTPSVAAPGDTKLSDATVSSCFFSAHLEWLGINLQCTFYEYTQ